MNESRAVAEKPRDTVVKFDRPTYQNLQRHCGVLPAIARLSCYICVLYFGCVLDRCGGAFSWHDSRHSFLVHRHSYLWTDVVRYQGRRTLLLPMGLDLLVHDVTGIAISIQ